MLSSVKYNLIFCMLDKNCFADQFNYRKQTQTLFIDFIKWVSRDSPKIKIKLLRANYKSSLVVQFQGWDIMLFKAKLTHTIRNTRKLNNFRPLNELLHIKSLQLTENESTCLRLFTYLVFLVFFPLLLLCAFSFTVL